VALCSRGGGWGPGCTARGHERMRTGAPGACCSAARQHARGVTHCTAGRAPPTQAGSGGPPRSAPCSTAGRSGGCPAAPPSSRGWAAAASSPQVPGAHSKPPGRCPTSSRALRPHIREAGGPPSHVALSRAHAMYGTATVGTAAAHVLRVRLLWAQKLALHDEHGDGEWSNTTT
jgi:hypothetical protein